MFNPLKTYRKLKNSKTWGEFFASYFIDLDEFYKQLEGKTKEQQIEALKNQLEKQQGKIGELVGEISKQKECIEKLENEVKQKDRRIKDLEESKKSVDLGKLKEAVEDLTNTTERSKKAFTEFRTKIEVINIKK